MHGFGCDVGSLGTLSRTLAYDGWRVFPLDLDTVSSTVETLAGRLARHVTRVRRRLGVGRVDLVGHSMGGLIIRYYVQMLDGFREVDRVVTIGTPHAGGTYASYAVFPARWLGFLPTPGPCEVHCADQLLPGSEFYDWLNGPTYRVENCAKVDLTNVWSLTDEAILPPWRARFPLATRERRFHAYGHLGLLLSGKVASCVRDVLLTEPHLGRRQGEEDALDGAARRPAAPGREETEPLPVGPIP